MAAEALQITDSSHIAGASYDSETSELAVTFKKGGAPGATYIYDGVPKDVADSFAAAPSAGSFLEKMVKGVFPFRKA